jgi:hypothetical protein
MVGHLSNLYIGNLTIGKLPLYTEGGQPPIWHPARGSEDANRDWVFQRPNQPEIDLRTLAGVQSQSSPAVNLCTKTLALPEAHKPSP